MARDRSPIVKQSRREGYALHPKAHKIMVKRTNIPGEHGGGRQQKPSGYALQLREKQKVRRLDNVVYRAGFATSRRAARQLVGHGHFMLNGKRVDIPSIRVSEGDEIVVREKSSKNEYFKDLADISSASNQPSLGWLVSDAKKQSIKITGTPTREESESDINE